MNVRCSLRRLTVAAGILAVGLVGGLAPSASAASGSQNHAAITSQTPLPVRNGTAVNLGQFSPFQTIRLAIGLKPPHWAAEQRFLTAIQTKSSPLFHHYLTVAQWTKRFGPTAASQKAVVSWARKSGLTITHLYPNRLVVDVSGPVASVQKAFGVQLDNYKLGSKTFYANNHDPVIPASLSGIVESVDGLSSLQTMFPASPGYREPASPVYSPGPVVSMGAHGAANGSHVKLRAAMRASRNKPNITGGAYDPTDIYNSQGYDYDALYSQSHCCNPLGNPATSPRPRHPSRSRPSAARTPRT